MLGSDLGCDITGSLRSALYKPRYVWQLLGTQRYPNFDDGINTSITRDTLS